MNRKNMYTFQMLTRVVDFGNHSVSLFPKNSAGADLVQSIESGMKSWSEETANQVSAETAMRTCRNARIAAREGLEGYLSKAAQLSRVTQSEMARARSKSDQALISVANSFLLQADALKKDFVKHALPADFADSVREAAGNLHQANLDYSSAKADRSSAAGKLQVTVEETMKALQSFDFLVANALEADPGALASYAVARLVPRARGRTVVKTESQPPAAVPSDASAPAPPATSSAAA